MQPICDEFFVGVDLASASSSDVNERVAAYLAAAREHLLSMHDLGYSGRGVNELHADLIDRLVRKLFRTGEDRFFSGEPRLSGFRIAVVAVGGYGRRELSLGSDVDLLFLYRGKVNAYIETMAETITHRLWDAKLTVGHATRTVTECLRFGRHDVPTMTSYLDGRFLIGDPGLFAELDRDVKRYMRRNSLGFIRDKLAEQAARHERMGESLFLLQPNVKESVGGLRDFHTAMWVARAARWEVKAPEHLRVHGFIEERAQEDLMSALEFMWRIRNELQRSGRKGDQLHYGAQEQLVEFLGIRDTPELLAAEQFMRQYYLHAKALHRVSEQVQDHSLQLADPRRARSARAAYPVADGFAIVDGKLEIPRAELLQERPARILSAFAVAQHHDAELSLRAQRMVHENLQLIDDEFRRSEEASQIFRQILSSPIRVYRTLYAMNQAEVLGAYIPEWAHLFGLWQHDMYHTYTVDVHSLFLVEQLRRIWKGEHRDELPLATELMREIREPFAVYLGCLLHDIGKGYGGGHCRRGAKMIPEIADRLGLSDTERDIVEFITLHHLTASGLADRRDVNEARTIQNLATLCKTRERLRVLYLSTIADIRSVSKEAWTSWKQSQLMVLYRNTMEWLEAQDPDASHFFLERAIRRASEAEESALESLTSQGVDARQAQDVLDAMPRRYLLNHTADEIAVHMQMLLDYLESGREVGVYSFRSLEGANAFWGIVVLAQDRPGLFAQVAGALSGCGHNVLVASVYTSRHGLAVEIYHVDPIAGGDLEEAAERERISRRLTASLSGDPRPPARQLRLEAPDGTVRARAPRVHASNTESDFFTVIDVTTNDRPALLYDITRTLSELGLDIERSRAATRANRATDSFYVSQGGHKITDEQRCKEIEAALLAVLNQDGTG
jgi:[protein-PII] uridylyltransferase